MIRSSSSPNTLCWPKTHVRSQVIQHRYPGPHCYPSEQVASFLAAHGLKVERYERYGEESANKKPLAGWW